MKQTSIKPANKHRQIDITFVTSGDPARLTGGNLYNRSILTALDRAEYRVQRLLLPQADAASGSVMLSRHLSEATPRLLVVDSIAVSSAALLTSSLASKPGIRTLVLMHMLPEPTVETVAFLSTVDWLVAVSPHLATELVSLGADVQHISVIPPGKDGVAPLPGAKIPCSSNELLCVANWSIGKGILTLVGALSRADSTLNLHLVGEEGNDGYTGAVRQSIEVNGLAERVHRHGPLVGQPLAERYQSADVFVLPSCSEGFGIVYAEAMSFGLPIIAGRVGPLPWLVGKHAGILVRPTDVAELSDAIDTLTRDHSLRAAMSNAAFQRAAVLPCWSETETSFCALVQRILSNPKKRALNELA